MSATDFDVVIVGAGQAGAALAALLLHETSLAPARVALLAPDIAQTAPPTRMDAPAAMRVVALSPGSQQVLARAGAWQRLPAARLCAYERMRVWHASLPPDGMGTLVFDAAELGVPALGAIVENDLITQACVDSFTAGGGQLITTAMSDFSPATLAAPSAAVAVTLADGAQLRTRLIVGADGANSAVRKRLGLAVTSHAYGQTAIIATVATARPHAMTAWQRFLPTGPVALLPLFNGHSSIVWTADDALAQQLLAAAPDDFARRLELATDGVLGSIELRSQRAAFPLERATARRLVGPRAALVGDAAHRIHPLAGQGINLGFLDVAALCEALAGALAGREDPGAARVLRRYEQQRLTDDTLMSHSMSAFNALFSRGGAAGWLGSRLLGLAAANTPARHALARRAMGLTAAAGGRSSPRR